MKSRDSAVSTHSIDQRAVKLRHLNEAYELPQITSRRQWEKRVQELRTHILAVNGLLPMPASAPLRAKVFDTIEHRDYSVSKVYFQSYPGLLVTGNLFVPRGKSGPFPAVLNPHGHWPTGRLNNDERGTILGRGITFARQGYVAFCYDMIGYNDSTQAIHPEESDRQRLWGFSHMSLQLYNSMRSVDFLQSLPEVDPQRIGCTGASGGGTQTFMLMAVDERIKVAAPVNMLSAHMQGGCVCENAPSLRLEMTNPEIGALMAPRPLLLVACTGDWTVNNPKVEYPFIRDIYGLYGAAERVECVQVDADHNYNLDSRNAVYQFFGKWLLGVDDPEALREKPYRLDSRSKYLVFADRQRPGSAPGGEKLFDKLIRQRKQHVKAMWPARNSEMAEFREQMAPAMQHLLMAQAPRPRELQVIQGSHKKIGEVTVQELILSRPGVGDRVPACVLRPPRQQRLPAATLVASPEGKDALLGDGELHPVVSGLLGAGQTIVLIDLWGAGAAQIPAERDQRAAEIDHYLTYNRSDDMNRIQDILTGLGYLRSRRPIKTVNLVGLGHAGLWTLMARTQAPFVEKTAVDMARLAAGRDDAFMAHLLIPAVRSIGDLATAAALIAPAALCLHNLGRGFPPEPIEQAYTATGAAGRFSMDAKQLTTEEIVGYVT